MRLLPERFRLKIIGGGKATLNEVDELITGIPQGRQRVTLTGHIPQGQIREYCAGAHISIIPQQESGGYFSPLKLNESLALGLPIVCTPLKVFERRKELVHQSEDCTPEALSKAILELAGNPEAVARLRARGIEEAIRRTWNSRASRILDFAQGL